MATGNLILEHSKGLNGPLICEANIPIFWFGNSIIFVIITCLYIKFTCVFYFILFFYCLSPSYNPDDNITVYTNISIDCSNIGIIERYIKTSGGQRRNGNTGEFSFIDIWKITLKDQNHKWIFCSKSFEQNVSIFFPLFMNEHWLVHAFCCAINF